MISKVIRSLIYFQLGVLKWHFCTLPTVLYSLIALTSTICVIIGSYSHNHITFITCSTQGIFGWTQRHWILKGETYNVLVAYIILFTRVVWGYIFRLWACLDRIIAFCSALSSSTKPILVRCKNNTQALLSSLLLHILVNPLWLAISKENGLPEEVMLKMILHFLPNKYFVSPPAAAPVLVRKIHIGLVAWKFKLLAASTQFVSNLTLDVSRVPKKFAYEMFCSTFS